MFSIFHMLLRNMIGLYTLGYILFISEYIPKGTFILQYQYKHDIKRDGIYYNMFRRNDFYLGVGGG